MQFSENWLREWVDTKLTTEQLAETLTNLGLEVDSISPAAGDFSGVVVAKVLTREQHPDADRLSLCTVDAGDNEPVQVVCGAPNVRASLKVAFAKVGGVLPGGFKIKKAKLRGVESFGMIASERELGLGEGHEGILELPDDAPVGRGFRDYLKLDDNMIDIDLTPNRGDCASICGVARDLAAKLKLDINSPDIKKIKASIEEKFPVELKDSKACPHYVGRVIRHVNMNVQTPLWMQEKLRRSGFRVINPVVDITNYVMLEYGQPMHAFDLDKLSTKVEVRFAQSNEKVVLLDGQAYQLTEQNLVIADSNQVQAVAGVMGAEFSGVTENTQHLFLESAFFNPEIVRQSARELSVMSDSSYRFERGVDPELQLLAVDRFCQLLQEICGGEFGEIHEVGKALSDRAPIELRRPQIKRLLGIEITDVEVQDILTRLGCQVNANDTSWSVVPPSYRFDLQLEADLIEELIRLYGLDQLPATPMQSELKMLMPNQAQLPSMQLQRFLADLGYLEAVTYSFVDPKIQQHFRDEVEVMTLANPIAEEQSEMRISLWPGLIQALQYNLNRQAQRVCLFETGLCFIQKQGELAQVNKLAGLIAGHAHSLQWGNDARMVDFFDLKGDFEQLLQLLRLSKRVSWQKSDNPALHPGQSTAVWLDGKKIAELGKLHPAITTKLDLMMSPYLFELNMSVLDTKEAIKYENISKFPAVRRDIAIVIDNAVSAELVENTIHQYSGNLLREVKIFDIYQGEGIESGKKSVALSLTFQDSQRTLLDEEINKVIEKIVVGLTKKLDASMRA